MGLQNEGTIKKFVVLGGRSIVNPLKVTLRRGLAAHGGSGRHRRAPGDGRRDLAVVAAAALAPCLR